MMAPANATQADILFLFVFTVSLGCFCDNVRSEPGSWIVVGMIPVFDKQKAKRAHRPEDGPNSCSARRIALFHQCYGALLQGWNQLTSGVKAMEWADGIWRRTKLLLRGIFADQPETDSFCCDSAQNCKFCHCPKQMLHLPGRYGRKSASKVKEMVYKAADGVFSKGVPLMNRSGPVWRPTAPINKAQYEKTRKNYLNGTHIINNAFWNVSGFDVQSMVPPVYCL